MTERQENNIIDFVSFCETRQNANKAQNKEAVDMLVGLAAGINRITIRRNAKIERSSEQAKTISLQASLQGAMLWIDELDRITGPRRDEILEFLSEYADFLRKSNNQSSVNMGIIWETIVKGVRGAL